MLLAAEQGHVDVAAKLIELGADVKHADKVMGACMHGLEWWV